MTESNRRTFLRRAGTGVTLGVSLTAGCLDGVLNSGPVKKTSTIRIDSDGQFQPKNAAVEFDKRAELTFENEDDVEHRVVSPAEELFLDEAIPSQKATLVSITSEGVYLVYLDWDKENTTADEFDGKRMKLAIGNSTIEDPIE